MLARGIILTTPIFFIVVLIVLWKLVRSNEVQMSMLVYLKSRLASEKRKGTPPEGRSDVPEDAEAGPSAEPRTDLSRLAGMVDSEE